MQQLTAIHVSSLRGVGPRTTESLAKAGLNTVWDLLLHLPIRYQDRSFITPMSEAIAGKSALFDGEVVKTWQQFAKKRMLCVKIRDADSELTLRWFNFNVHMQQRLQAGVRLRCYGAPVIWQKHFEIMHPELEVYSAGSPPALDTNLRPIYRLSAGVTQNKLYSLIQQSLQLLSNTTGDNHCDKILNKEHPSIQDALMQLHNLPCAEYSLYLSGQHPAEKRLIIEELLAQLWFLRSQRGAVSQGSALQIKFALQIEQDFLAQLPYDLTGSQLQAVSEIYADLASSKAMRRLLQGDVGSGKTVVAALATVQVAKQGLQTAWLAPTTVLAEQHAQTLRTWLEPLGIAVACLTSAVKSKPKHKILEQLVTGELLVVVGTHAVFQDAVNYKNLTFLVIDEQHRFGVSQRAALHAKALSPHCLSMTATPIPRTLMQSWFAGVASSQLTDKPSCRLPIITTVVKSERRAELLARILKVCKSGGRVYWVCSLVEEGALENVNSAVEVYADLQRQMVGVQVGLVHGKMPDADKQLALQGFASGALQLLVATTVIEVGVDVPEATIIVVDNPERLGLAQLHQLRGRVGRSAQQSYCVLLAARSLSAEAVARLQVLRDSDDGFYLAEQDLRWRGPGHLLGAEQTGYLSFKIADLLRDAAYLPQVNELCDKLLRQSDTDFSAQFSPWLPGKNTNSTVT